MTKEQSMKTAAKYLNQDKDVLELSLQWISYDDLEITEENYSTLTEKVMAYGLSENPPSYADFVKSDFE